MRPADRTRLTILTLALIAGIAAAWWMLKGSFVAAVGLALALIVAGVAAWGLGR